MVLWGPKICKIFALEATKDAVQHQWVHKSTIEGSEWKIQNFGKHLNCKFFQFMEVIRKSKINLDCAYVGSITVTLYFVRHSNGPYLAKSIVMVITKSIMPLTAKFTGERRTFQLSFFFLNFLAPLNIKIQLIPMMHFHYQWLKILNIKHYGTPNTFWANSIIITLARTMKNHHLFCQWLKKKVLANLFVVAFCGLKMGPKDWSFKAHKRPEVRKQF